MDIGDIVVFPRNPKDFVSGVLLWVLKRLDKKFAQWCKDEKFNPWHTAPIVAISGGKYWTLDAGRNGATLIGRTPEYLKQCKVYKWFDNPSDITGKWSDLVGSPYDRGAYFGTVFFYVIARITGKSYRVHDQELQCWELTSLVSRRGGKPLQPIYEYPLIPAIIEALEGK